MQAYEKYGAFYFGEVYGFVKQILIGLAVFFCLFSFFAITAQAADANALLKQVNKELRQAQKDMFDGKTEKSIAALENIQSLIVELKTVDKNNAGIKSVKNKYHKLVKDLERRTGRDLDGGTLTAGKSSNKAVLSGKPVVMGAMDKKVAMPPAGAGKKTDTISKEADIDVKVLKASYDRCRSLFGAATGKAIYYNDIEPVEKLIVQIENFEANELAGIVAKMKAFADKYGATKEEIDKKAVTNGYSGRYRASFPYVALSEGIANIKRTRTVMAEDLVKTSNECFANIGKAHDFHVVGQYGEVKARIEMAGRYQFDNPKVKEALSNVDQQIDNGMKALNARIGSRKWPDHASNAPSNAGKLAEVALDWFKNDPDWGKRDQNSRATDKAPRKPLSVVVTGPWSIQKKNILSEPIMYGLPILLAVRLDSDKDMNVIRVFSLTMGTMEKRGVNMGPPFDHATVGHSYFIRPGAIK